MNADTTPVCPKCNGLYMVTTREHEEFSYAKVAVWCDDHWRTPNVGRIDGDCRIPDGNVKAWSGPLTNEEDMRQQLTATHEALSHRDTELAELRESLKATTRERDNHKLAYSSLLDTFDRHGAAAEKIYGEPDYRWQFGEALGDLVEDAGKWKEELVKVRGEREEAKASAENHLNAWLRKDEIVVRLQKETAERDRSLAAERERAEKAEYEVSLYHANDLQESPWREMLNKMAGDCPAGKLLIEWAANELSSIRTRNTALEARLKTMEGLVERLESLIAACEGMVTRHAEVDLVPSLKVHAETKLARAALAKEGG